MNNLTKYFTVQKKQIPVLSGIHLDIHYSDFILIKGVSGIGKSTLLKLIAGVSLPSNGSIRVSNTKYSLKQFQREKIGFVFQNFNLIDYHTILENVMLPLKWTNSPSKEHPEKARHLLDKMNLLDKQDEFPYKLSGGELQRVSIARALIKDPALILADEPFSNLDEHNRNDLMRLFINLNTQHNIAFVFAMHEAPSYYSFRTQFEIKNQSLLNNFPPMST